jgi:hypothetical protein
VKTDLEPAGIGGWLILPAIGLAISPFWQAFEIIRDILPSLDFSVLRTLSDPASDHYSALWVPTIVFEVATSVLTFAFTVWLAYLFFLRKSPLVPRLFIIWLAYQVILQTIDWNLVNALPVAQDHSGNGITTALGRSITNAVIWIPYFIWSVRVRNTFIDTAAA